MKKCLTMMILAVLVLAGCKKEKTGTCQCYDDQVYNAKTGECDCVQPFPESERPVLKTDDYNSWYAVRRHFIYKVKSDARKEAYPYYSHEGDTLLLCGWIDHTPLENRTYSLDSMMVKISLLDDSSSAALQNSSDETSYIACPVSLLKHIDIGKKIYVRGTITFNLLTLNFDVPIAMPSPYACWFPEIAFKVLEIKN